MQPIPIAETVNPCLPSRRGSMCFLLVKRAPLAIAAFFLEAVAISTPLTSCCHRQNASFQSISVLGFALARVQCDDQFSFTSTSRTEVDEDILGGKMDNELRAFASPSTTAVVPGMVSPSRLIYLVDRRGVRVMRSSWASGCPGPVRALRSPMPR